MGLILSASSKTVCRPDSEDMDTANMFCVAAATRHECVYECVALKPENEFVQRTIAQQSRDIIILLHSPQTTSWASCGTT